MEVREVVRALPVTAPGEDSLGDLGDLTQQRRGLARLPVEVSALLDRPDVHRERRPDVVPTLPEARSAHSCGARRLLVLASAESALAIEPDAVLRAREALEPRERELHQWVERR